MIPQIGLVRHDPDNGVWGDCWRACIASVLDYPIEEVPHFNHAGPSGGAAARADERVWLADRGLAMAELIYDGGLPVGDVLQSFNILNPGMIVILSGKSALGAEHSVIAADGEIIHDPSPVQSGIVGPSGSGYWYISLLVTSKHRPWSEAA